MQMITEKKQRRINTDQAILDAARVEIGNHGYSKAKLSNIAKRANISIGLIGQNFGSKEELLVALIRREALTLTGVFGIEGDEDWKTLFDQVYDHIEVLFNDEENGGKLCLKFFTTIVNDVDVPDSALVGMVETASRSPLIKAIAEGQKRGEVKEGECVRLLGLYYRTVATALSHCMKFNIKLPKKELFAGLLTK